MLLVLHTYKSGKPMRSSVTGFPDCGDLSSSRKALILMVNLRQRSWPRTWRLITTGHITTLIESTGIGVQLAYPHARRIPADGSQRGGISERRVEDVRHVGEAGPEGEVISVIEGRAPLTDQLCCILEGIGNLGDGINRVRLRKLVGGTMGPAACF